MVSCSVRLNTGVHHEDYVVRNSESIISRIMQTSASCMLYAPEQEFKTGRSRMLIKLTSLVLRATIVLSLQTISIKKTFYMLSNTCVMESTIIIMKETMLY